MSDRPRVSAPKPPNRRSKKWSDVLSSSRQVWLAGLGALAEAQSEGAKALDALVKRGQDVEQRLLREAQSSRTPRRSAAGSASSRGTDKLALIFEQRVARALDRLGMRQAADVTKLAARVDRLSAKVDALSKQLAASEDAPKRGRARSAHEE